MNTQEKSFLKLIIENNIKSLQDEIIELEGNLEPIKQDCSLDGAYHQSLAQEQDIQFRRYEESKKKVIELINTLKRLEKEDYGICQECEEDIYIERLKLVPESTYCIHCINELGL